LILQKPRLSMTMLKNLFTQLFNDHSVGYVHQPEVRFLV